MEFSTLMLGLAGLALLGLGGDTLVRGAVGLAAALGISPLFTGLVLVGFGTSVPELATSLHAALHGSPGIAVGNVLGSNIVNILLILGLTAVITPIPADPASFRRDAPMLAVATLFCVAVVETDALNRLAGALFLVLLAGYLLRTYRIERAAQDPSAVMHANEGRLIRRPSQRPWLSAFLGLAGLASILVGADLLVTASIGIASALGISDELIGLTVVAVGTSLPELATALMAAIRRETDIAFGNVLGSNIFNILGILGTTAVVRPLHVPEPVIDIDAWVLLGVTGLLLYYAMTQARVSRGEGAVFLLLYAAYIAFLTHRALAIG